MDDDDLQFTLITGVEQRSVILSFAVLSPIFCTLAILMFFVLLSNLQNLEQQSIISNIENDSKPALFCAAVSLAFSLIYYSCFILLVNNFIIPWEFTMLDFHFADISSAIMNLTWVLGKMFFYAGFTFHVMQIFTSRSRKTRKFLRCWMYTACVCLFILNILFIVSDAVELGNGLDKIGVLIDYDNIKIAMFASHASAHVARIAILSILALDMLYMAVLLFIYVRQSYSDKFSAVKGFILMIFACITLWAVCIAVYRISANRWWLYSVDVLTDDISLFLMFGFNHRFYIQMCGCCHRSASKMCFGGLGLGYVAYNVTEEEKSDEEEQNMRSIIIVEEDDDMSSNYDDNPSDVQLL